MRLNVRGRPTQYKDKEASMISIRTALAVTAFAAAALVSGCGGASVNQTVNTASVGKQLEDLKKAYDAGIINKQEYERTRDRILSQSR
jgi:hypothetical protein